MTEIVADHAVTAPAPALAPYVRRYVGYRYLGLAAGIHRGLPSCEVTVVLGLDGPTRMAAMPDPTQPPADLDTLAGGLHAGPVAIAHGGAMEGIQLGLTPAGARALLHLPAAELAGTVVGLDLVVGAQAGELLERLQEARGWPARFALLDRVLTRRIHEGPGPVNAVREAWHRITAGHGGARIADVADAVGYSRRRLDVLFAREYGLAPKQLARIARFERAHTLLKADPGQGLAGLAAGCGFSDQAHMTREWHALAGCSPTRWLRDEGVLFVQDKDPARTARSAA